MWLDILAPYCSFSILVVLNVIFLPGCSYESVSGWKVEVCCCCFDSQSVSGSTKNNTQWENEALSHTHLQAHTLLPSPDLQCDPSASCSISGSLRESVRRDCAGSSDQDLLQFSLPMSHSCTCVLCHSSGTCITEVMVSSLFICIHEYEMVCNGGKSPLSYFIHYHSIFFERNILCSPRLHLLKQKYSTI